MQPLTPKQHNSRTRTKFLMYKGNSNLSLATIAKNIGMEYHTLFKFQSGERILPPYHLKKIDYYLKKEMTKKRDMQHTLVAAFDKDTREKQAT